MTEIDGERRNTLPFPYVAARDLAGLSEVTVDPAGAVSGDMTMVDAVRHQDGELAPARRPFWPIPPWDSR